MARSVKSKADALSELKPKNEEKKIITASSVLDKFLKDNKTFHYNFEKENFYQVSTGSLKMDIETEGGFGPGLHRFTGPPESGKSSAALQVLHNFLLDNGKKTGGKVRKRRGIYFKAEGRLSLKMRERSGINFVFNSDEWADGTCFVFESNIYETVVELMKDLVFKNEEGIEYFFIVDSVDGLMLKSDVDKEFTEAAKIAGGPVIASVFMKQMSIPLSKRGHIAFFLSQNRADIKIDAHSKAPIRNLAATGGNALHHYANWIWEFGHRWNDDHIRKDQANKKADPITNPIVGHWVVVTVKKSPNEKSNMTYKYPVKYNRTAGRSVWVEKEIVDLMVAWETVTKAGSWLKFDEEFVAEVEAAGIDLTLMRNKDGVIQLQGQPALFQFVENHDEFRSFAFTYFKTLIHGILNEQNKPEENESQEIPVL